jgi:hypothetical protein
MAKIGRGEEVVPLIEQRGYQKEERDETVPPGYRLIGALTTAPHSLLRFARALDDAMT